MENNKKVSAYQKLVEGIEQIVTTGQYENFLKSMRNFHSYSFSNRLLIFAQNPDATRVAGFCTWKKLGRGVKSKPKRIFILRPMKCKIKKETDNKNVEETDEIDNVNEENQNNELEVIKFCWTIVYDIEDTYVIDESKDVPLLDHKLNSNTSKELYETLLQISPVEVKVQSTYNGSDGYYSKLNNKIVISSKLSQDDATSTLLHEISHALYDDFEYAKERMLSEIFVESVAYIVANYFGLDTKKSSFAYVTSWSEGDIKKILELGPKIQKTSDMFIEKIENQIAKNDTKVA